MLTDHRQEMMDELAVLEARWVRREYEDSEVAVLIRGICAPYGCEPRF
jgi:hypothetical protein